MAVIKIDNLSVPGTELFADDESYMKELSEPELQIQGGYPWSSYFTGYVSA